MGKQVWDAKAKWMGNLIPLGCMFPLAAIGVLLMVRNHAITPIGIALCLTSLVIGWLAVNQFGFFDNPRLSKAIARKTLGKVGRDASNGIFVGFARPSYVGLLDAHEDLGFVFLDEAAIEYLGELHHVRIERKDVLGVRFRSNVHSWLGLGRWVSIDAMHKGKPIRVLIEPREAATLLANKRRGTELKKQIEEWRKDSTRKRP